MESNQDIKVILDNENFTILKPLTLDALCEYDKNHYFCDSRYSWGPTFNRPNTVTFIFINKKNNSVETFRRIEDNSILDNNENEIKLDDVLVNLKEYFGVPKDVTKRLLGSNFFNQLRAYLRGQISSKAIENADPLVLQIRENDKHSEIILNFDDSDQFLEKIGLSDDDIQFYNWVTRGRWDFRTYDSDYEDMKEGYGPFWEFNEKNENKLRFISNFLMPGVEFVQEDAFFALLFRMMYEEFPRVMDSIIEYWTDAVNEQMNNAAEKDVTEDLKNFFSSVGLVVDLGRGTIKLNPEDILRIYSEIGDTRLNLSELFDEYFKGKNSRLGGWYEDQYEYESRSQMDMDYLNNKWGEKLDDIIEKLEDDEEKLRRIYKLHQEMNKKYGFRKPNRTPKDRNLWFQILGIDKDTGKIATQIIKTRGLEDGSPFAQSKVVKSKNHEFSEENFNLFLNQPELFNILDEK